MTHYIYGKHAVTALLTFQPKLAMQLFIQTHRSDSVADVCVQLAQATGIAIAYLSKTELQRLVGDHAVHQGVVLQCRALPTYHESDISALVELAKPPFLLVVLDGVQDPHNLGACLRVANAYGACGVIAPKDKSVALNATAIKVSCGAALLTPFIQVTNLARVLSQLKELAFWLVGTSLQSDQMIQQVDLRGNIALVMGSEGFGLRELTARHCDFLARIPMVGSVESLNVATATAIALYETYRQRC